MRQAALPSHRRNNNRPRAGCCDYWRHRALGPRNLRPRPVRRTVQVKFEALLSCFGPVARSATFGLLTSDVSIPRDPSAEKRNASKRYVPRNMISCRRFCRNSKGRKTPHFLCIRIEVLHNLSTTFPQTVWRFSRPLAGTAACRETGGDRVTAGRPNFEPGGSPMEVIDGSRR